MAFLGESMLFSSITFLYYFLPITLACYFLAPKKYRNLVLFFFSLIFYGWGEPKYLIWMMLSIGMGYLFGCLLGRTKSSSHRKTLMVTAVLFYLGLLGYFKLQVTLPVGISFYTFQILSYVIDVYRQEVAVQKNFVALGTYVTMFPQLVAGPIVRYSDIEKQLREREVTKTSIWHGVQRFSVGVAKKVLLANCFGELCAIYKGSSEISVLYVWMYAIAFTLQIYFDFSGYSDMAIGLGEMMGFHFMENFNYPYISKTVTEFWRRWHISLGTWFRDYVYIPLGGNRRGLKRQLVNIFLVWCLTGIWHGAEWNFLLWGMFYAVLLMFEKCVGIRKGSHLYTMFAVLIGFVLFDAASVKEAFNTIANLFGIGGIPLVNAESLYYLKSYLPYLLIGGAAATPLLKKVSVNFGVVIVLLLLATASLIGGSFNPFLYFRF